jgi:hypothetical protein
MIFWGKKNINLKWKLVHLTLIKLNSNICHIKLHSQKIIYVKSQNKV